MSTLQSPDYSFRRAVRRLRRAWIPLVAVGMCFGLTNGAHALITGGTGNDPVADPGWPAGAEAVFNVPARVAWWEGPPFGGGQWHGEYRGDAAALNRVLEEFARIDADKKRMVVHDGVGRSFWLNPNREPQKEADARIDWTFTVWQFDRWQALRNLPAEFRPAGDGKEDGPVPQIDVYTGGNIRWEDVTVPEGIEVVDERLEARGYSPADGIVLEGAVKDLATGAPLAGRMRLARVEPRSEGGYRYTEAATAEAGEDGRWVLKHAPAGWHRVVVEADGYVPRVAGYGQFGEGPRWFEYTTALSRPAPVSGVVTDAEGEPLEDVEVRLQSVAVAPGGRYESPDDYTTKTDADGRFELSGVPRGTARVGVHKEGYCHPGLGPEITMPAEDISLTMVRSATILVTVDFGDAERPAGYIVEIEEEGGGGVGSWGGSANLQPDGTVTFEHVPPGTYILTGRQPGTRGSRDGPDPDQALGGRRVDGDT